MGETPWNSVKGAAGMFLRKTTLKMKITLGFLAVLLLMSAALGIGLLGFRRNEEQMVRLDVLARETEIAARLETAFLKNRLAFRTYQAVGQLPNPETDGQAQIDRLVDRFNHLSESPSRLRHMEDVHSLLTLYNSRFDELSDRGEELRILTVSLKEKGEELVTALEGLSAHASTMDHMEMFRRVHAAEIELLIARRYATSYIEGQDPTAYGQFRDHYDAFMNRSAGIGPLTDLVGGQEHYAVLRLLMAEYDRDMRVFRSSAQAYENLVERMGTTGEQVSALIGAINASITIESADLLETTSAQRRVEGLLMGFMAVLAIGTALLVARGLSRLILNPIGDLTREFEAIAGGDASRAFNRFMERIQTLFRESEHRTEIITLQHELNDIMRREMPLDELIRVLLDRLVGRFEGVSGAFYLATHEGDYRLVSRYGQPEAEKSVLNEGEGLLGMAIARKAPSYLDASEAMERHFDTATTRGIVPYLTIQPTIHESYVNGLIEIGFLKPLEAEDRILLEKAVEEIGDVLYTVSLSEEMKRLLDRTIRQAERLQQQQEELRQNNEELEQQAQSLMASESELQAQQEELRVSNEELGLRSKRLEEQQVALDEKNRELLEVYQEVLDQKEALEEATRHRTEFYANMSHELRTPLNSILVLSELLMKKEPETALSEKEMRFAETIHRSGNDLLTLIDDVLDLSKIESGKLEFVHEDFELEQFLIDHEHLFAPMAEVRDLRFDAYLAEGLPETVVLDRHRVSQVVKNLLSNAIKFTKHGAITLGIRQVAGHEGEALGLNPRRYFAIDVEDTGIGIPEDKRHLIFEAFRQSDGTTSREYGGTGLGLAISREITKQLGGHLQLKKSSEKGSLFTLILPIMHNLKEQVDSMSPVLGEMGTDPSGRVVEKRSHEEEILVVSGEAELRERLLAEVKAHGHKVRVLKKAQETQAYLKEHLPRALILDPNVRDATPETFLHQVEKAIGSERVPLHLLADQPIQRGDRIAEILRPPLKIKDVYRTLAAVEHLGNEEHIRLLVVGSCGGEDFSDFKKLGACHIQRVRTGEEALSVLDGAGADVMVLDRSLEIPSAFTFLEEMDGRGYGDLPIVLFATGDEEDQIVTWDSEVEKTIEERRSELIREIALFLRSLDNEGEEAPADESLAGRSVLVVDDDERNLFSLVHVFERLGMSVHTAKNGIEALELLEQRKVDLLLVDLMMPKKDGLQTIREIREREGAERLPILALSAKTMVEDRKRALEVGADDYLTKPIAVEEFIATIKVWLS
jgi:signal transduction histidine kinase/DNA-binding response OmpR family regulator